MPDLSFPLRSGKTCNRFVVNILSALVFLLSVQPCALAQGNKVLFGDVHIRNKGGPEPTSAVTVVLFGTAASGELGRQTVSNRGRYRFSNLKEGEYEIAIEVDGREIGRLRNIVIGPLSNSPYGFQYDLDLDWKAEADLPVGTISAADVYKRSDANQALMKKAQDAAQRKKFDQAATYLKTILENDGKDFQAWSILGTIYVMQEKSGDAEKAYAAALELRPTFSIALLNLGKLRSNEKRFDEAIDPLTRLLEIQPQSPEGNLLLGEAYLQIKKGSRAIPYLEEAARLGRLDAHLRLGWLYNAAGLKERAANEYAQLLKKKPDYADRKKLEEYISANQQH